MSSIETLQTDGVAVLLVSGFVDKENSSFNKDQEEEKRIKRKIIGKVKVSPFTQYLNIFS